MHASSCWGDGGAKRPMKGMKIFSFGVVSVALLLMVGPVAQAQAENIRIGGTGFGLGVMKILAATFEQSHPRANIEVIPSLGSTGGIKALLQGALDVAISGRPLNETERARGIGAREIAQTPFVFVVNAKVSSEAISLQELEDIYGGVPRTWSDGTRIRPVLRPETDTTTEMLRSLSAGMHQALTHAMSREGMLRATTDQESAEAVEETPGALASSTLTQVYSEQRRVKILAFNGVRPSGKSLRDGTYPLSLPIYLVTPLKPREMVRQFLDFISSEAGREILMENGNRVVPDAASATP